MQTVVSAHNRMQQHSTTIVIGLYLYNTRICQAAEQKLHEDWNKEILNMLKISADEYMTC